jgi:hypothetical protein
VTLLPASEEYSTSTSSMPANSNSFLSNIHLNSSFLKIGLNWPVFEGYPVLKQQTEVYKNGPENNRIDFWHSSFSGTEVVLSYQEHL